MKNIKFYFQLLAILVAFSSCDDVIDLDLKDGKIQLVIDGQLDNNAAKPDTILLKWTANYFANKPLPAATGATVKVTSNDGATYVFAETAEGSGKYVNQQFVGEIGKTYTVNVTRVQGNGYENETFSATSLLKRVPPIDSLKVNYRAENTGIYDKGYYIKYFGPEFEGSGDYYRFKMYVNGKLRNQPSDLAFTSDQFVDGNYINDIELSSEPCDEGDTVVIETLSLTEDTYKFYIELQNQMQNGGLFSPPFSNVRTNVVNNNAASDKTAVGYFRCVGLSSASVICKQ